MLGLTRRRHLGSKLCHTWFKLSWGREPIGHYCLDAGSLVAGGAVFGAIVFALSTVASFDPVSRGRR